MSYHGRLLRRAAHSHRQLLDSMRGLSARVPGLGARAVQSQVTALTHSRFHIGPSTAIGEIETNGTQGDPQFALYRVDDLMNTAAPSLLFGEDEEA